MEKNSKNKETEAENILPEGQAPEAAGRGGESVVKAWQVVLVCAVTVLVIALSAGAIVFLNEREKQNIKEPLFPMPWVHEVPHVSVMVNDERVSFDVVSEDDKTHLPVVDFAEAIGCECTVNDGKIELATASEIISLAVGSKQVWITDKKSGAKEGVKITTAPFRRDGSVYIYVRDTTLFLDSTISFDSKKNVVKIDIEV